LGTQSLYDQIRREDALRQRLLDELRAAKAEEEEREEKKGGPATHVKRLAEVGVRFTDVVLTALERGTIGADDASEYLDISPDRLQPLAKEMRNKIQLYG